MNFLYLLVISQLVSNLSKEKELLISFTIININFLLKVFRFFCRGRVARARAESVEPRALCRKPFEAQYANALATKAEIIAFFGLKASENRDVLVAKKHYNSILFGKRFKHAHKNL